MNMSLWKAQKNSLNWLQREIPEGSFSNWNVFLVNVACKTVLKLD